MTPLRHWLFLGLFALAVLSSGCDVAALPWLIAGPEPSDPATLKQLASSDKDKDKKTKVKVAILASSSLELRDQLERVDRELTGLVVKHLSELCKNNEENVVVLQPNVIERYKTEHPDWERPLDLVRIGEDLKVKYVIYLEINSLSLYLPKSNNQFYQGETDIKVSLLNVRKPDEAPEEDLTHEEYPTSPVSTFDNPNPMQFRHKFLDHVAEKIAWKFTKHPTKDKYGSSD